MSNIKGKIGDYGDLWIFRGLEEVAIISICKYANSKSCSHVCPSWYENYLDGKLIEIHLCDGIVVTIEDDER